MSAQGNNATVRLQGGASQQAGEGTLVSPGRPFVFEHGTTPLNMLCNVLLFLHISVVKLSSGLMVIITNTNFLPTPMSVYMFHVDSQRYCFGHVQNNNFRIVS